MNDYNDINNTTNGKKKTNSWIYIVIILLLLVTNLFLFFKKRYTDNQLAIYENRVDSIGVERQELQLAYNASLARLDELTGENTSLNSLLKNSNQELSTAKSRIETILSNNKASANELKEAKALINKLNTKIDEYERQIVVLKSENKNLKNERDSISSSNSELLESNEDLRQKVDIGKMLKAANIRIMPINLRRGNKERETIKAKRVDVLRILFDIEENKLAESGDKEFYARIISPDGYLLSNSGLGSGKFKVATTNDMEFYSISKKVNLTTGKAVKNVQLDWEQSAEYEKGNYTIEIYHDGYLIGSGKALLK